MPGNGMACRAPRPEIRAKVVDRRLTDDTCSEKGHAAAAGDVEGFVLSFIFFGMRGSAPLFTTLNARSCRVPIGDGERKLEMAERVHRTQIGLLRPNANPNVFVPEKEIVPEKLYQKKICTIKSGR